MKKLIIFILLVSSMLCFSNDFTYYKVVRKNFTNSLEVGSFSDFQNLIHSYKIIEIFYDDEYFIIDCNNKLIQLKSYGYKNIKDYEIGINSGFHSGFEYYEAKKYSIENYTNYSDFINDYFITFKDKTDAIEQGFKKLSLNYFIIRGLYTKSEIENIKIYLNWIIYLFTERYDVNVDRLIIANSEIKPQYLIPIGDKYFYIDLRYMKKENKDDNFLNSLAINYYLSKICNYVNLNNFISASEINIELNDLNTRLLEYGYPNLDLYLKGVREGFLKYDDYRYSRMLQINKYSSYEKYKDIVTFIETTKTSDKNLKNIDCYILYELNAIDSKKSISMEMFVERLNQKLQDSVVLSRYIKKNCSIDDVKKVSILNQFKKIALFSFENNIITRK